MQIINNRYRVVENLEQNRVYSVYECTDIMKDFLKVKLYILNSNYISQEFVNFCISKLERLTGINNECGIEVLDFGVISNIDNKKILHKNYFYTTQYISDEFKIENQVQFIHEEKLIEYFSDICRISKRYFMSNKEKILISLDDIYLDKDGKIKIKDLITFKLENVNDFSVKENDVLFLNLNPNYDGKIDEIHYHIYSLGVILLRLTLKILRYDIEASNIIEAINCKNSSVCTSHSELLGEKLYHIIYNCLVNKEDSIYKNIEDIILEINKLYEKDYAIYIKAEVEKLNLNIPIIGRDEEINSLIGVKEFIFKNEDSKNIITIHGEIGIGKTRLLTHMDYILKLNREIVQTYLDTTVDVSNVVSSILKQMIPNADKELVVKYQNELSYFAPEIKKQNLDLQNYEQLPENRKKYVIIGKISSFIREFYADKQGVIIIDAIDRCDEFTIDLLQYLITKLSNDNRKLIIILSYRDGECLENKKFMEFLSNIREFVKLDLILKPLNKEKVVLMIKEILDISKITNKFTDKLYLNTMGNPLFVEEILKDLLARKKIYINSKTGSWYKDSENEIYMPRNMDETCKNQIEKLESFSLEILQIVSVFYTPISVEIIKSMTTTSNILSINHTMNFLMDKGIMCRKISDNGFVFDFYNKFLKNYMYNDISKDEKREKHRLAAKILCTNYNQDEYMYLEEIIHHLEQSDNKRELVHYYAENAKRLVFLKNVDEAIKYNLKVLEIINSFEDKHNFLYTIIITFMELGDLYSFNSDKSIALKYYLQGKELCKKIDLKEKEIDFIFKIIGIHEEQGDEEFFISYLDEARELVYKVDYIEGTLHYKLNLCRMLLNNQQYEKVKEISSQGLELSKKRNIDFEVNFKTIYCTALMLEDKIYEVLDMYTEFLEEYKDFGNNKGINKILNDIGVIYSDYIQDFDEALIWFEKVYKLSKENNNTFYEVIGLSNIGFIHFINLDRISAYNYFKKSVEKSYKYQNLSLLFYSYTYLGYIMTIMGNYEEAYKYYLLCEDQLRKAPNQGKNIGDYYLFLWELNKELGEIEKAYEYLDKAYEVYKDIDCIIRWNIDIFRLLKAHTLRPNDNDIDIVNNLIIIGEKILNINFRIKLICQCILSFIERDFFIEAKKLLDKIKEWIRETNNISNIPLLNYIEYVLSVEKNKELLDVALDYCKKEDQFKVLWRIHLEIGNYYYNKGEYSYSTIFFFEACAIISDVVEQVPLDYRVKFFKENIQLMEPFKKFNEVKTYYCHIKNISEIPLKINNQQDINLLFNNLNKESVLNNEFVESLKNFSTMSLKDINNLEDLIKKLGNENLKNLELISQYICYITLASRVSIIIDRDNQCNVIASSNKTMELPNDMTIVRQCINKVKPIIFNESQNDNLNIHRWKKLKNNLRAVMCIPIILENERDMGKYGGRNSDFIYNDNVLGYIYIESDRILHNINDYSKEQCITISKILGIILDKHNIKISSTIDKLTGTFTRKYLEKSIQDEIDRAYELNNQFSIVMFDIDKFKDINDTFGHRSGDKVLKQICEVVLNNIRQTDIIGRYGGEEFIIILPDTDVRSAEIVAQKIRQKIESKKILGDKRPVTVSLGVANYPEHSTNYEELIEKVDQALYEAKNIGRNAVKVWNEKYKLKGNTTNKLSGILVGTGNQDYKNVSTLIEFIDVLNEDIEFEKKISYILDKITEIIECDDVGLFIIEGTNIVDEYLSKSNNLKQNSYNLDNIQKVITTGENICIVDWDNILEQDIITDIPEWKSIIVLPLKNRDKTIAVLYLSVSAQKKEFNFDELNFANTLGKFILNLLKCNSSLD